MADITAILSLAALLTAIASYVDKYEEDRGINSILRLYLQKFYKYIDSHTFKMSKDNIYDSFLVVVYFTTCSAVLQFILWDKQKKYERDISLGGWTSSFAQFNYIIGVPIRVLFKSLALMMIAVSPFILIIFAYGLIRLVTTHILRIGASPKVSPLGFTTAILGVAIAFGKVILDVTKAIMNH